MDTTVSREQTIRQSMIYKVDATVATLLPPQEIPDRFRFSADFRKLDWMRAKNRKAVEYCEKFANGDAEKAPLLLGPSGTGKTHLLFATYREVRERYTENLRRIALDFRARATVDDEFVRASYPEPKVDWGTKVHLHATDGAEIAHDLRQSIELKNLNYVVAKYRQVDPGAKRASWEGQSRLLIVDDIETMMKINEWLAEEIYRIFNFRYAELFPTAIASNLSMAELQAHLSDRIARRIFDTTEPFVISK